MAVLGGFTERLEGELFERDAEVRSLERSLDAAAGGQGEVTVVAGRAGIGKSRLLETAVATARERGFQPLVARADEGERDFPFAVVLQLFEARLAAAGAAERRRLLEGPAALALPLFERATIGEVLASPPDRVFPFVHGLYWLTANLSEREPLLIAVDDVQAADEPSLRFLLYLVQRLEGLRVAVVAAGRFEEGDGHTLQLAGLPRAQLLRPAPLGLAAAGALVEEALGFEAEPEFRQACLEVTGGNPFLLHELAAALAAEGVDQRSASAVRVSSLTPDAVTQRLLVRLLRLPDPAAALARAVSVLGDGFPLRIAAKLAGIDPSLAPRVVDALATAEIMRPLDEHERVRFAHPLVRASLYEDQPAGERAATHALAARLLLDEGGPREQVVAQLMRSQRGAVPRAAGILSLAAADARARGAPRSAAAFLERALEEPLDERTRVQLQLQLAETELAAGAPDAAERAALSAASTADEPETRACAQLVRGRALYAGGRFSDAAAAFEAGLDLLAADGDSHLAHELRAAYATAAALDVSLAPRGDATAELIAAEAAAEPTLGERAVLAQLAAKGGFACAPRDEVRALAERAWGDGVLLVAEGVDGTLWTLVTAALACANHLERNVEICGSVLDAARAGGSVLAFATASYCRSLPLFFLGRIDDAIADAEVALDAHAHGWHQHRGSAAAMLAWALIEQGKLDAASAALAQIDDPGMPDRVDYALLLAARAQLALVQGNAEVALRDAREAGRRLVDVFAMRTPLFDWRSTAALAAAAVGDVSGARSLCEEQLDVACAVGAPAFRARALRVRGLVEGGERGLELLEESVNILTTTGARLGRVRALVDYGAALRRAGHRRGAREPLAQGLELAARGGAHALAARARAELAALGARPRRAVRTGAASLTASERRVAEMAAGGITNKQIAQALFVTVKTVEGHLHHAYQKLNITSRDQIGEALSRNDGP